MILGGEGSGKGKVPKNNNFFSDPFPKLKEGISVKNNLRKNSNDKENDFTEEIFCLSQYSRTI